jgi:hypothetical protein
MRRPAPLVRARRARRARQDADAEAEEQHFRLEERGAGLGEAHRCGDHRRDRHAGGGGRTMRLAGPLEGAVACVCSAAGIRAASCQGVCRAPRRRDAGRARHRWCAHWRLPPGPPGFAGILVGRAAHRARAGWRGGGWPTWRGRTPPLEPASPGVRAFVHRWSLGATALYALTRAGPRWRVPALRVTIAWRRAGALSAPVYGRRAFARRRCWQPPGRVGLAGAPG